MKSIIPIYIFFTLNIALGAAPATVLFDGSDLDAFEFREGAWSIDSDGVIACHMEKTRDKKGRVRGMGYLWTKQEYEDFVLTLSYKLSEGANTGVFYRTDKDDPVQGGFEIQLVDSEGFQKAHGEKDPKNLNGAFYDAQAASSDPGNPVGEWNQFKLICNGPRVRVAINGVEVVNVNVDDWDTPKTNPDGSGNKFKTALKDMPRNGQIGFQNHGQYVWFKNMKIRRLK